MLLLAGACGKREAPPVDTPLTRELDALEARLETEAFAVARSGELKARHEQLTGYACSVDGRHLDEMNRLAEYQVVKRRRLRQAARERMPDSG